MIVEGGCAAGGEKGTLEQIQQPDVSALAPRSTTEARQGLIRICYYLDLHYASVYLAEYNLPCVNFRIAVNIPQ
jgi:hypothetical protein